MNVGIIIPAAGSGERFGGELPKQYRLLGGIAVLRRSVAAMLAAFEDARAVVAIDPRWQAQAEAALACFGAQAVLTVGGATRQHSVRAALEHPSLTAADVIVVHDAVRPFASAELARRVVAAAWQAGAAVPVVPPKDTVKLVATGRIEATLPRQQLALVQTPQAFRAEVLRAAYHHAEDAGIEATDDASLVERAGFPVATVEGDERNLKITTPLDWAVAECLLARGLVP